MLFTVQVNIWKFIYLNCVEWYSWVLLRPVHTNPFSNESGAVLLRIRLSSTLQRRKRSPKTLSRMERFENDAFWKRCSVVWTKKNDAIWKRWRHENRHDRAPDHSTVSIQNGEQTLRCGFNFAPISQADILKCACVEFIWACTLRVYIKAFSKRIRRCSVGGRKRY